MACSQTPLARKLGIKDGGRVALVEAPEGLLTLLSPLPTGVELLHDIDPDDDRELDVIVSFFHDRAVLVARFRPFAGCLATAGGLWVCWPKKSSGVATDLSDGAVREIGLAAGLVDNKVCAIDATWSALRFVRRLSDRPSRR